MWLNSAIYLSCKHVEFNNGLFNETHIVNDADVIYIYQILTVCIKDKKKGNGISMADKKGKL